MKILITGVAGFLGSHLAEKLLKLGQLVYKNEEAKQFCFRTPNKKCIREQLRVYKIDY